MSLMISELISFGPKAILAMVSLATLSAQSVALIDVTEPRPLMTAIDALESINGFPINYEDPPYESLSDLQDVSTVQDRALNPAFRLLVPRTGRVTAEVQTFGANGPTPGQVLANLNLLLSSYRGNALPGDFKLEEGNAMLYVTATAILGANGAVREVQPR
jgi:hypothetical protein